MYAYDQDVTPVGDMSVRSWVSLWDCHCCQPQVCFITSMEGVILNVKNAL